MGNVVGVIVEYNPLHNGHVHHLEESKKAADAEAAVAVMSGHWLQRGEPAFMNKWARAETALLAGVDLVLELPVVFSTQPAEWFAYGAVSALTAAGIVDSLCFGSESGAIDELLALSRQLASEPDAFAALLQEQLKTGAPYPAAYAEAAGLLTGSPAAAELAKPNNSLGFHYLMALSRLQSPIKPLTIHRIKAGYHDTALTDRSIASATAIRAQLLAGGGKTGPAPALSGKIASYVPPGTLRVLEREWSAGRAPLHWERYAAPLFHRLLVQPAEQLAAMREVTEGLEHRIKKSLPALGAEASVEKLLEALKTKRYTRTKLQRMLTSIFLEHTKAGVSVEVLRPGVPYLRVLGFTEKGRKLLNRMKQAAAVPVITDVGRDPHPLLALDAAATAAYALGFANPSADDWFADYFNPPVRVE